MFEIDYKLTLEDELNAIDAEKEYILNLPFLYRHDRNTFYFLILIIVNLPDLWKCLTSDVPLYVDFQSPEKSIVGIIFNFAIAFLFLPQIPVILPIKKYIQKYKINKSLKEDFYPFQFRKIIATETKFIFIKDKYEKSWFWEKLTNYFESDTGFILEFGSAYNRRFIPKHIFKNEEQMNEFKKILVKHKN